MKRVATAFSALALALTALSVVPGAASADQNCGHHWWEKPCGIVHNRSGSTLEISRDSANHWYCDPRGPYGYLPDGTDSNAYFGWRDVDCFRSLDRWVYTNLRWYPPGEWVRVWTAKWVFG
jgi:hypothetical protein